MARMRRLAMTAIAATTGASLAYVFFATPSQSSQSSSHPTNRRFSPPPELPSSSKLLVPNINLRRFDFGDPEPDTRPPQCDYGPLWECIVNGNGGCEVLEEDLRNCLEKSRKPEPTTRATSSQCDYAPLWECIVNGNGGCEVLEEDFRNCLERSKRGLQ